MKEWNSLEELTEWETRIVDKSIRDKPLNLKPLLLCFGISDSPLVRELAKIVNPSREKRTGNTGIPLRLSNNLIINALTSIVYEEPNGDFTAASPFRLEGEPDNIEIYFEGSVLDKAELIKPKNWFYKKTKTGKSYSSILLSEAGSFLMAAIPTQCVYQTNGKACLFCEYQVSKVDKKVEDFVEAAVAAFKEYPYYTLTLTGGNIKTDSRGIKQYIPYVKGISSAVKDAIGKKPPIQIEASPPDFSSGNAEKCINEIVEAGATSFMMNLEQGDIKYRRIICPEKSKIPLSDYLRAFKYIIENKGLGAASVLINNLAEPPESTLKYAKKLAELGVKPIILPFWPRGKLKRNYPTNPLEFEQLYKETMKLINKYDVDLSKIEGCANCPGCALVQKDVDYG